MRDEEEEEVEVMEVVQREGKEMDCGGGWFGENTYFRAPGSQYPYNNTQVLV